MNETEIFKFPQFASQLTLEVRTDLQKCQSYSDYNVIGYFDNNKIFNITVDEFIKKVENEIWSEEKVDEYCGFITHDEEKSDEKEEEKNDTTYKSLMIIFACCTAVLTALVIFLIVKLSKKNKEIHPINEILNSNSNSIVDSDIKNL